MAIARGAGTEIIRSAWVEDVNDVEQKLIIGEQHHIYTVLSITICCLASNTPGTNIMYFRLKGYDSKGGTTAQEFRLLNWTMGVNETFVWNDKFSFNGHEPTNFTGPLDDATKQNAVADQGSSVAQKLRIYVSDSGADLDITVTFIDQNNA